MRVAMCDRDIRNPIEMPPAWDVLIGDEPEDLQVSAPGHA